MTGRRPPRRRLREGLRAGDLEHVVLPLLSVDEYESKVSDSAVVIAFYVHEKAAADDLNRFVQKSAITLIDTEVSPAPDQRGYFLVFVELLANDRLVGNLLNLLKETEPLVNISQWSMHVRGVDGVHEVTERTLADWFKRFKAAEQRADEAAILGFLHASDLSGVHLEGRALVLEGGRQRRCFEVLGFGPTEAVLQRCGLSEAGAALAFDSVARCRRLADLLGPGWSVTEADNTFLCESIEKSSYLLAVRSS